MLSKLKYDAPRHEMIEDLKRAFAEKEFPRFTVGKIDKCRFGVVDKERGEDLGLHFEIDLIDGGGTCLQIFKEEALVLLKRFGHAEKMNGLCAWIYIAESFGVCRFVCLVGDEYK